MSTELPGQGVPLELDAHFVWPDDALRGVTYANTFAVFPGMPAGGHAHEQAIYIVAAQISPPIIGDDATLERFKQFGSSIPVLPVAKLAVPMRRAKELRDLLSAQIALMEQQDAT